MSQPVSGQIIKPTTGRAIGGGLAATTVMTMMIYAAPSMGLPKMDIAAMLGKLFNGMAMPEPMTGPWWAGMIGHLMMGIVLFPLIYSFVVYRAIPGADWLRGLIWGVVLFLMMQAAILPMMGMGFFASNLPNPMMFVVGTLVGHAVYGIVLGAMAGHTAGGPAPNSSRGSSGAISSSGSRRA